MEVGRQMVRTCARFGPGGIVLTVTVLFFAAAVAALLSHLAIDVLGDYLLSDDAYDHVAHHSRALVFALLAGGALASLAHAVRAALREARGSESALCDVLRGALPGSLARYLLPAGGLTLLLVIAMEALDAALAGRPTGELAALLGGSPVLGFGLIGAISMLSTAAVRLALRRLAKLHRRFVGIVVAFVGSRTRAGEGLRQTAAWPTAGLNSYGLRLARRAAGRAPPS